MEMNLTIVRWENILHRIRRVVTPNHAPHGVIVLDMGTAEKPQSFEKPETLRYPLRMIAVLPLPDG
jgi:hypothetical protein